MMATLSMKAADGTVVSVEVGEDATAAGRRFSALLAKHGGPWKSRAQRKAEKKAQRSPLTAQEQKNLFLQEIGKLECQACGNWVENTRAAAATHRNKCKKKRTLN
jgi:hypothetical protein